MIEQKVQMVKDAIREGLSRFSVACVTSSFQSECVALVHMILEQRPDIPVLFLETGYHFPETLAYRDKLAAEWKLNLRNLATSRSVADQEAEFGLLYQTDPNQCCKLRKVGPLFAGLSEFETWFTALRREQSKSRAQLQVVEPFKLPGGKTIEKISPMADWTTKDVWTYMTQNGIPELPLYEKGFTSIGCQPCTQLPIDPNDIRSGRWQGKQKLECGIHIQAE